MSIEPITSAEQFADALSDVANRYMRHLEPSAEDQEYGCRLSMTGKLLNIEFGKAPGRTPNISFTLQSDPDAEAPTIPSGLFGRRS